MYFDYIFCLYDYIDYESFHCAINRLSETESINRLFDSFDYFDNDSVMILSIIRLFHLSDYFTIMNLDNLILFWLYDYFEYDYHCTINRLSET